MAIEKIQQLAVALFLIDQLQQHRADVLIRREHAEEGSRTEVSYRIILPRTEGLQQGDLLWNPDVPLESAEAPLGGEIGDDLRERIVDGVFEEHRRMMDQGGVYGGCEATRIGSGEVLVYFQAEGEAIEGQVR